MAIDFRLTTEQQNLRETARDFAQNLLAPLVPDANATRSPHDGLARGPERADDSREERRSRPSDGPSRPLTAAGRWVRGTGCQAKILNCLGAYNVP
jgi:hypothetical protein